MPYTRLLDVLGQDRAEIGYDLSLLRMDNPRRPLTAPEVRQFSAGVNIVVYAFSECADLDVDRLSACVNCLQARYPFLCGSIVYDPELRWMRYEPPEEGYLEPGKRAVDFRRDLELFPAVRSGQELTDYYNRVGELLDDHHLSLWRLLRVERPDLCTEDDEFILPSYRYCLVLMVPHSLGDGSSFSVLHRKLNELYSSGVPIDPEHVDFAVRQQTCFRPILAAPAEVVERLRDPAARQVQRAALRTDVDSITPVRVKNPDNRRPKRRVMRLEPSQFFREPGRSTSMCLSSVSLMVVLAYGYMHGDFDPAREEPLSFTVAEVRRMYEFFEQGGSIPGLDLHREQIGQGATMYFCPVSATYHTSVLDIVDQLATHVDSTSGLAAEARWALFAGLDLQGIAPGVAFLSSSVLVSNVGRVDLGGEVPFCTTFGGSNADPRVALLRPGNFTVVGGRKHGTHFLNAREDMYYPYAYLDAFRATWLRIHALAREEGTFAGLTVGRCVEILRGYVQQFADAGVSME